MSPYLRQLKDRERQIEQTLESLWANELGPTNAEERSPAQKAVDRANRHRATEKLEKLREELETVQKKINDPKTRQANRVLNEIQLKRQRALNPQYLSETQSGEHLFFIQDVPKIQDQLKKQKEDFKAKVNRMIGNNINQYINEVSKVVQNCRNEMRRSNNKNIR